MDAPKETIYESTLRRENPKDKKKSIEDKTYGTYIQNAAG